MSKELFQLSDAGSERALIGSLIRFGKNAFIEADGIISASDFSLPINRYIYSALKSLAENPNCEIFDIETIKMQLKSLGLDHFFNGKKEIEYLELLNSVNFSKDNITVFAFQIKKYSVMRDLHKRYDTAKNYLENISGNESLSEIIRNAEGQIIDFVSGIDDGESLSIIGENIEDKIEQMINSEPITQVGIPTGYPLWDEAIGGGLRKGTIAIIGSRSKVGKSFMAMNMAYNLAYNNIPVLYLDSELTKDYQQNRLIAISSGCPIWALETYSFTKNKELVMAVKGSKDILKKLPLHYKSIAGMDYIDALSYARQWLVKSVGFNESGEANNCAIIYDYMKLTSVSNLTKVTPEYILLGMMLTDMHNFCVKYKLPIIGFVQLNREGIDGYDTSIIAGSDRILWLCSSMSIMRNKDDNDVELGCSWEYGNKKLSILETRQGSGLETENDYINLHANIRPKVNKENGTGVIREGLKFTDICYTNFHKNETATRND